MQCQFILRVELVRQIAKTCEGLEQGVDVVVAVRIGVVGLMGVGEADALQPLHRFEAVGLRYDHAHRAATLAGEKFAIELVAEHHGQFAGRIFKHAVHRQVAFEDLLRVLVVVAVIPDMAQVFHRPALPQHIAQRHALPQAMPQRIGEVVAGDDLQITDRLRLRDLHELFKRQRRAIAAQHGPLDLRIACRIGDNFKLPRLAQHADLTLLLDGQFVRQRIAALHIVKISRRRDAAAARLTHRSRFLACGLQFRVGRQHRSACSTELEQVAARN